MSDGPETETTCLWYEEAQTKTMKSSMTLNGIFYTGKTKYQKVQVVDIGTFGKCLVLDGKMQSALSDEFVYHETLVQPAMMLHPNPKKVFIGGGGELATAREILRHKTVERCVMVDIDEEVVDLCRAHLPEWNAGVCEDPRMEVVYTDAWGWLRDSDELFDVIYMDICDPLDNGPGNMLYTVEFYQFLLTKLTPGGLFVTQSGPVAVYNIEEYFGAIHNSLAEVFDCVVPYASEIPSFAGMYGFNVAFNRPAADANTPPAAPAADGTIASDAVITTSSEDVCALEPVVVDARLAARLDTSGLRYYDGITHRGIFNLSKFFRNFLATDKRTITMANPVVMGYGEGVAKEN